MAISDVKTKAGAKFKATGASLRQNMTDEQKLKEGSKRDKVAFVCCLADPNRKQSRMCKSYSRKSFCVVGYKFELLEDTLVPNAPLKENPKTLLDTEEITLVPHKAGEIVALNLVETGAFISREEYAGQFTGKGRGVYVLAKYAKTRGNVPLPALRYIGSGSVKEDLEFIADMVGATDTKKGTPVIKEEYKDKFGVLYKKKKSGQKPDSEKPSGEAAANVAAAFRNYYKQKTSEDVVEPEVDEEETDFSDGFDEEDDE